MMMQYNIGNFSEQVGINLTFGSGELDYGWQAQGQSTIPVVTAGPNSVGHSMFNQGVVSMWHGVNIPDSSNV